MLKLHTFSLVSTRQAECNYQQKPVACLQANGVAKDAGVPLAQPLSGLSLKEENDMRVEHALDILKADVSHCTLSVCTACHTKKSRFILHPCPALILHIPQLCAIYQLACITSSMNHLSHFGQYAEGWLLHSSGMLKTTGSCT